MMAHGFDGFRMVLAAVVLAACGAEAGGRTFGEAARFAESGETAMAVCLEGSRLYADGGGGRFCVFDVSRPLSPKLLGEVRGVVGIRQIAVQGGMAYVAARENALWIVDAKDPAKPRIRSRFDCCELATGVDVSGDVLFLGQRQNGVEFIDVSNPDRPAHIAMRKTDELQSLRYAGGILYCGEWGTGRLTIFDVRDMRNIRQLSRPELYGYGDGVWTKGRLLYAATGHHARNRDLSTLAAKSVDTPELRRFGGGGPGAGCGHGLDVFDVSDPSAPRRLGRVDFPPLYTRGNDFWTVRTSGASDIVFCADTHNGLFAVDGSDPSAPRIVDRWMLPPTKGDLPSRCVASLAVGDGCVYVAVRGAGLFAIPAQGAGREAARQDAPPKNASYREDYPTDESEFWVWRPERPGQVRGVALRGDTVYAACGDAGLHVLKVRPGKGFEKIGELAGHPRVFDVAAEGDMLFTAEGPDGFGFYGMDGATGFREAGRLARVDDKNPWAFWVWAVDKTHVVLSARSGGDRLYDISNLGKPKFILKVGHCPGWDKYMMDRPVGGGRWLAHNAANSWIDWIDLSGHGKQAVHSTRVNRINLASGICRFDDNRALATLGSGYVFLAPGEGDPADGSKWRAHPLPGPQMNGIPRSDGRLVVKTNRIKREIALYDFKDSSCPVFLKHWKVAGNPDVAVFHDGKIIVPCGYQGLLMQK